MASSDRNVSAGTRLTARDRMILAFAADQRVFLVCHVGLLLECSEAAAGRRLRALTRSGYLERRAVFHLQPSCHLITSRGLSAIQSPLARPRLDMRGYVHDLGLAWVALAAGRGALGPVSEVISERRMRSADGLPRESDDRDVAAGVARGYGVRLWALGGGTHEQVHYPDLLLRTVTGQRVAVELELSSKSSRRLEKIMNGYGTDQRIHSVLYLTDQTAIANRVQSAAAHAGVSAKVQVQPFAWTPTMQRLVEPLRNDRTRPREPRRAATRAGIER